MWTFVYYSRTLSENSVDTGYVGSVVELAVAVDSGKNDPQAAELQLLRISWIFFAGALVELYIKRPQKAQVKQISIERVMNRASFGCITECCATRKP